MGISMFALLLPLGLSGRADQQVCVAVVATMLGTANAASGILLKWKAQFACAVVWWLASAAALFGTDTQSLDRVSCGDFLLPDRVRNLRDDSGVARRRRQGAANA